MSENKKLTLDDLVDCRQHSNNKRSLLELDTVIDEIVNRNPDWVAEIKQIIDSGLKK
jgi:hypothetical protein